MKQSVEPYDVDSEVKLIDAMIEEFTSRRKKAPWNTQL